MRTQLVSSLHFFCLFNNSDNWYDVRIDDLATCIHLMTFSFSELCDFLGLIRIGRYSYKYSEYDVLASRM